MKTSTILLLAGAAAFYYFFIRKPAAPPAVAPPSSPTPSIGPNGPTTIGVIGGIIDKGLNIFGNSSDDSFGTGSIG